MPLEKASSDEVANCFGTKPVSTECHADFHASVNVHRSFYKEIHWQPRPKRRDHFFASMALTLMYDKQRTKKPDPWLLPWLQRAQAQNLHSLQRYSLCRPRALSCSFACTQAESERREDMHGRCLASLTASWCPVRVPADDGRILGLEVGDEYEC